MIGDAAGFVDLVTLEGISYALLSGKIAAQTITESLTDRERFSIRSLSSYANKCKQAFYGDFKLGRLLTPLISSPDAFGRIQQILRTLNKKSGIKARLEKNHKEFGNLCYMFQQFPLSEKLRVFKAIGLKSLLNAFVIQR